MRGGVDAIGIHPTEIEQLPQLLRAVIVRVAR